MTARRIAWSLGAVLVVLIAGARLMCAPRAIGVETYAVARGRVETRVANSEAGTVRARHEARLAAERTGRVIALEWREGDVLPLGAMVLQLDTSSERERLHAARHGAEASDAAHRVAHADAELASREYARVVTLHTQRLASDASLEEARAHERAASARLAQAEAQLDVADAQIAGERDEMAHRLVRMPFRGVLTRKLVEAGESVVPGQAVAEVMTLDSLDVHAPLDERDAADVRVGQPVRVTLDPFPGRVWSARVARVSPVVEETRDQNRTLTVEVALELSPRTPTPRPGMSADLEVLLGVRDSVLRVPTRAILDGRRVLVIERGHARARDVVLGARNWDWSEVKSGVAEGEPVIVSLDRAGVVAGARVRADDTRRSKAP